MRCLAARCHATGQRGGAADRGRGFIFSRRAARCVTRAALVPLHNMPSPTFTLPSRSSCSATHPPSPRLPFFSLFRLPTKRSTGLNVQRARRAHNHTAGEVTQEELLRLDPGQPPEFTLVLPSSPMSPLPPAATSTRIVAPVSSSMLVAPQTRLLQETTLHNTSFQMMFESLHSLTEEYFS